MGGGGSPGGGAAVGGRGARGGLGGVGLRWRRAEGSVQLMTFDPGKLLCTPPSRVRVSTEVTFGRGDLSVCPLGGFIGRPMNILFLVGGVSPRGPHRDKR